MMEVLSLAMSLGIGLAFVYLIAKILGLSNSNHPPLPPGPKGIPLVGNLNDLPQPGVLESEHWLKFKELYGSLSC